MKSCFLLLIISLLSGLERVPLEKVDIGKFTTELQISMIENERNVIVYILPSEFWRASLSRNPAISKLQLEEFYKMSDNRVMVFVVDFNVGGMGNMNFRDPKQIISEVKAQSQKNGKAVSMLPVSDDQATYMIDVMGLSFARSMGKMGEGMAVMMFQLPDDQLLRYSPYEESELIISYGDMKAKYLGPIDALYVPRVLKDGRRAHVSWKFDPWTGESIK